jgi:hypothetical protein
MCSWTYRLTTDPAPTLESEKVGLPFPGRHFASGDAFDLYLWFDRKDGTIRLDEDFQAEYLIDA